MKTLLLGLSLMGMLTQSLAQKLDTVYRNAGYGQMEHTAMFKDVSGNTIIGGGYASSISDIDPGPATVNLPTANNFGFYLIKYSNSAAYVSHMSVQGNVSNNTVMANDIARDNAGNYYVAGDFTGTIDFDPFAGIANYSSGTSQRKAFIAKYDPNFNLISVNTYTATNYSSFQSIKVDGSGKIYGSGYFWGTQDMDFGTGVVNETSATTASTFFVIYDSGFNLLNRFVNFGRLNAFCEIDNSGNIYLAGNFETTSDFDPSAGSYSLTPVGGSDIFIAKYNSSMTLQWASKIGNVNTETLKHLKLDYFGNPILTGIFSGTVDFDPGASTYNLTSITTNDYFLMRVSALGAFHWARHYQINGVAGNLIPDPIAVDNANNVYFTGSFNGTQNFNNSGTAHMMTASGDMDGFVEKLDNTGTQQWCFRFGGSSPGYNYSSGHCISVENSGQITVTGAMRAVNDFDPSPYDSVGITAYTGFYNSYIATYNQLRTQALPTASLCAGVGLSVPFTIDGNCQAGNVFTAQLSDASGDFSNPVNIGSLNGTGSGTISATIPSTVSYGTGYRVRVVSSNPVQRGERSTTQLFINAAPSINTQPSSATICAQSNFTFTANVSSNANAMQWYHNSLAISGATASTLPFNPAQSSNAGIYYLHASNSCGSANSASVTLTINSPSVTISGNTSVCSGNGTTLTANGALHYSWNTGANTASISSIPSSSVSYTVTGVDAIGCADTKTITVTVNSVPSLSISPSSSVVCVGNSATLSASGADTYSWSSGATGATAAVSPTTSSSYTVTGTSIQGCTGTQSISIAVNPLPIVSAMASPSTICSGQSATLTASGTSTYTWSNNASSSTTTVNPGTSTSYTVLGTNMQGCTGNTVITVNVSPLPSISIVSSSSTLCAGQTATLNASGATSYTWNTGSNNASAIINPTVTTTYSITGITANSCSNTATFTQPVVICTGLEESFSQNVLQISPNPFSDHIRIHGSGINGMIRIVDAIGRTVYEVKGEEDLILSGLQNLASGLYYIVIPKLPDQSVYKLIKE